MRHYKRNLILAALLIAGALLTVTAVTVSAATGTNPPTEISPGGLPKAKADSSTVRTIIGIVNGLAGAIALLVLVVNGLRYITSGGDPQKAANAKNGVVFALVGIAVVLAAQAIVVFVVTRLA